MKISIIGSGYVGENTGTYLHGLGHEITFLDINESRLSELKNKYKSDGISFTNSYDNLLDTEASFICVPTPTKNGKQDLSYIISASASLGSTLKKKDEHLVVVKSTVLPGTTRKIVKPILEKSGKVGEEIFLCASPEFITQISNTWTNDNSMKIGGSNKLVIGEYDKKSGDWLEDLYKNSLPVYRMGIEEAEYLKYTSNSYLSSLNSFWNERFLECEKLGIDIEKITSCLITDTRISKYGTKCGKAFGGSCLPKDSKAHKTWAKELGTIPRLLMAVDDINEHMKEKYGVRE